MKANVPCFQSKTSVIVPAYNAKAYLARCLDSILAANPYEIILVEDCSTDGTYEICKQYANVHSKITLYQNPENQGVAMTRQHGIHLATGTYVTFVDADDWVEANFLMKAEKILEEQHDVQIVIGKVLREDWDGTTHLWTGCDGEKIYEHKKAMEELFYGKSYGWEVYGKIYHKSLFDDWRADPTVRICEDLQCTWQIFRQVQKVMCMDVVFYHYFFNEQSATNTIRACESNAYKVFEEILQDPRQLSDTVLQNIRKKYRLSLINQIRELALANASDQEIRFYQEKISLAMPEWRERQVEREIFHSPQSVRNLLERIECEVSQMEEVLIHRKEEFHQNVYVYGTGVVASLLSFFLEKHGFTDFEYVVSRNQCKRRSFRGKYVCYISEISSRDEVILALNPDTQKEVSEELRKQGFQNLYYVNTYGIA